MTILALDTKSPIFIGGQRCSGMRELGTLLDRYSGILCGPPLKFFQRASFLEWHQTLTSEWSDRIVKFGFEDNVMDRSFAALIDNLLTRAQYAKGKSRWAERTAGNILRIDYLLRLFPRAQFIHMIRDPRDTLTSMKQQTATHKPYWDKFTADVTGPEWVKYIECGKRWRDRPEQYIEVQYEQLVAEPEAVLREVLAFLGEVWLPEILDPSSTVDEGKEGNEHKLVFRTSVGRWDQDLTLGEIASIQAVAGDTMVPFGYDLQPL